MLAPRITSVIFIGFSFFFPFFFKKFDVVEDVVEIDALLGTHMFLYILRVPITFIFKLKSVNA